MEATCAARAAAPVAGCKAHTCHEYSNVPDSAPRPPLCAVVSVVCAVWLLRK